MQRPITVTVSAWVIIALATEGIAGAVSSLVRNSLLSQLADPHIGVSLTAQLASLLQVAVIVCAIFMLRGANWARIVYVVLTAFTVVGILAVSLRVSGLEFTAAHTIVKAAVLLYVLFRSEANAYFGGPHTSAPTESPPESPPKG
jgi:hypothetical protein